MKQSTVAAICCLLGGWLLLSGGDGVIPGPTTDDILGECYEADRASTVAILRDMAGREFASNDAAGDFWNEQATAKRIEDFTPKTDAVAEAIFGGTLSELADSWEAK